MGLAGALYVSFIGFISPFDFVPIMTFQIWTMLIVGGSGNNKGALLGALIVWGLWSASGTLISKLVPAAYQTQGGAIQAILIGLVARPDAPVPAARPDRRRARGFASRHVTGDRDRLASAATRNRGRTS